MNLRITLVIAFLSFTATLHAERISLVGATVINPADGKVLPNATVTINGDKIERVAIGKQDAAALGKQISCPGKFILPGYIDTHVHFFQSADLFTRPDGTDLNAVRPYKDEVAWIKSHLDDVFARYIRCGITSVVDVGGPMWNFEVRKKANATAKAPRVAVAGPLISSVSREKLDLGDPPIVKIDTPDQARDFVRKLAEQKPDLVKIWYIVDKDHPVESFRPIVRATIEESHAHKTRVAVHATELETARAAVEVAQLAALVAEKGNTNAVTDAGVAALLAAAAAKGAAYNVRVNVQALEDRSKGQSLARDAEQLAKRAGELADRTSSIVERALSS